MAAAALSLQIVKAAPMRISDFIERTSNATSPNKITDLFKRAISSRGYERFAYGMLTNYGRYKFRDGITPPALAVDYPDAWVKHYFEQDYLSIDPIISRSPVMRQPYLWDELSELSPAQNMFMSEANEAGLGHGICVPIHGPFGESFAISMTSDNKDADPSRVSGELHVLATQYHSAFFELIVEEPKSTHVVRLTPRERECLVWSARGKNSWDTGEILDISEHTVNFHLKNSMAKLDASSRILAVVKAIRTGLILP
ncbi:MAG: LuxR family transcriptional regulator [Alphaproteobacteria bacterium]|jgi:LuxR family quorum-sensing system transcriptional regulator CciR|nr:LuxR family transcriptional regulator [Alphaproteobacteria bacterium]MDP6817949.1 LuxR family transcriptional regulator [Alphaproteobacteria bacterium]